MNDIEINELKKLFEVQKKQRQEKEIEYLKQIQENQIRFEDCKEGYTYKVDGRNFQYAIFHNGEFYGIRYKFGDRFLDTELHWDTDEKHGTVRPQEEIEKTPDDVMMAINFEYDPPETNFNELLKYFNKFAN